MMCASDIARLVLGYLSEKGLEKTKNAFSKESPDLLESPLDNMLNQGQTLSLIVEEYLVLRANGRKADPESVLLLLWKQFDVLVGQLKHTTIHNPGKEKHKGFNAQRVRVRQLNRSNWTSLQQKNNSKSLSLTNHDAFINPKPINVPKNSPQRSPSNASITPKYVQIRPNPFVPQSSNNVLVNPQIPQSPHNVLVNPLEPQSPHNVHLVGPQSSCNVSVNPQIPPSPRNARVVGPQSLYNTIVSNLPNEHQSTQATVRKTPRKSAVPNARHAPGVLQSNVISESIQEVNSSEQLHSDNEHLLPGDHFKSPKRKSVTPKKRTGEAVAILPYGAQVSAKTDGVTSTQDDSQLDIQTIVDKILGRPELPEKLAENINRAVEIDGPTTQQSGYNTETENIAQTQSAVLDGNKVNDILEMMKSDPVFEELFSNFETFESSYEESDAGQAKDSEPTISSKPSSSSFQNDQCANVALDALLMLASSPVRPQSSGSLETPRKKNASPSNASPSNASPSNPSPSSVLSSPSVPATNPSTLIFTSNNLDSKKRPLPPLSVHIRQLDFGGITGDSGDTSQGTFSGGNKYKQFEKSTRKIRGEKNFGIECSKVKSSGDRSSEGKISQDKSFESENTEDKSSEGGSSESGSSEGKSFDVIPKGQLYEVFVNEGVVCGSNKRTSKERTSQKNLDKMTTNEPMSIVEKKCEIGQHVENHPFGQKKSDSSSEGSVKSVVGYKDISRCSDEITDVNTTGNATEKSTAIEKPTSYKDSPSALEELATNELLQCQTVQPDSPETLVKASHGTKKGSLVENRVEEGCNRTTVVMLSEPTGAKDTATKPSDGLTSSTEELTNIKTPESSAKNLCSSTDSDKSSKRKLKKKKKSSRTSKKAKIIPDDLDVDKFLSRLHYAEEEKT